MPITRRYEAGSQNGLRDRDGDEVPDVPLRQVPRASLADEGLTETLLLLGSTGNQRIALLARR
jgi:hypothetical protein